MKFNETREITAVLLIASKLFNVGIHSDIYESICIKVDSMIDTIELYFDISLLVLDFDSRLQEGKKSKTVVPIILQSIKLFE